MATKRVNKELKELMTTPVAGCTVSTVGDNILNWRIMITGPADTPYEGGSFEVSLEISTDYPFKPPTASFLTKIFHPNVNGEGKVCMDILTSSWTPRCNVTQILVFLISSLTNLKSDDSTSLNPDAAHLLLTDVDKFNETAKQWTQMYAK